MLAGEHGTVKRPIALKTSVTETKGVASNSVLPVLGRRPEIGDLAAREKYSLLKTCNTWTARALRSAGLPITFLYAVSAGNLMDQTRPLGRRINAARRGVGGAA
jgi:hypothetical protein